jgi:hypothetical protein
MKAYTVSKITEECPIQRVKALSFAQQTEALAEEDKE